MSVLKLEIYPSNILRVENQEITKITPQIKKLIADMIETMYHEQGIGLAAPQIGHNLQIAVIDVSEKQKSPTVLINPQIIKTENKIKSEEGCLSIPGYREVIPRFEKVKITALDQDLKRIEIEAEGLLARCLQHEIDHLQGILFIDHLGRLKKRMFEKWFQNYLEHGDEEDE